MRKTFIITLWAILVLAIGGVALIFSAIADGKIGYVPPVEELENPNLKFATQIISDDGVTMGTYSYSTENRIYVGYEDLSPYLVKALIATEDERFAEHSGIDAKALMRAIVKRGILMQKNAGGSLRMLTLICARSRRLMPGFLATPQVMTTMSESSTSLYSPGRTTAGEQKGAP